MKNMNRLFAGFVLAFGTMALLSLGSQATITARSPKECKTIGYTTVISSVTQATVAQSTNAFTMPGAVYAVYLSSGTTQDYLVMLDTITATGYPALANGVIYTNQLGPRMYFGSLSSSTVNTAIYYDPPMPFFNGLMAAFSAATEQATICYELGRGLSGQ